MVRLLSIALFSEGFMLRIRLDRSFSLRRGNKTSVLMEPRLHLLQQQREAVAAAAADDAAAAVVEMR